MLSWTHRGSSYKWHRPFSRAHYRATRFWAYLGFGFWVHTGTDAGRTTPHLCTHCHQPPTSEDHDACLGTLPYPVMNACCGHGQDSDAHVQFCPGLFRGSMRVLGLMEPRYIEGAEALKWIAENREKKEI